MVVKQCFYVPDEEHPDFETDVGKWWLCKKGKKYSVWRFDKKNSDFKQYLLLRNKDSKIMAEDHLIEGIGIKHDIYERMVRK